MDDTLYEEYIGFVEDLLAAQPFYVPLCVTALVKRFVPDAAVSAVPSPSNSASNLAAMAECVPTQSPPFCFTIRLMRIALLCSPEAALGAAFTRCRFVHDTLKRLIECDYFASSWMRNVLTSPRRVLWAVLCPLQ
jgi:hypothetical protein